MESGRRRSLLRDPRTVAALLGVLSFGVYVKTLTPTVGFIDAGELAAVAGSLGIAHPSGYPLFTLLAAVAIRIPLPVEEIVRLNLLAALFCSLAVAVFTYVLFRLIGETTRSWKSARGFPEEQREWISLAGAAGGGLTLAFSETFWLQAVGVEVYSLHVLFLTLVLGAFGRAARSSSEGNWQMVSFLVGLSFTNHMTTVLVIPGLLYWYVVAQGLGRFALLRVVRMIPVFLLGLSVYLYIPLRAGQGPLLNWGNPVTWERFLWHVTGKQYRVWIFSSPDVALRQLGNFIAELPHEFAAPGLILAGIGVLVLWKGSRHLCVGTLLLFATCILYAINYDIHDIDSYFLLAYLTLALWVAMGLGWIFSLLAAKVRQAVGVALALACAVGMIPLVTHLPGNDQSGNYFVEDYTRNMFRSLPGNALVLSYQWDYWVSASYYYQVVRKERPDLVVIDKELLRRSWYLDQLQLRYPWLIDRSRGEVEAFRVELDKFEHDRPYRAVEIQARFVDMIRSFLVESGRERPVYITGEIEPDLTVGYQRVPDGLALRLAPDTLFYKTPLPVFAARGLQRRGKLEDYVRQLYGVAYIRWGDYQLRRGGIDYAIRAYREALQVDPESPLARNRVHSLGQAVLGKK